MTRLILAAAVGLTFGAGATALAHGIAYAVGEGGTTVRVVYDDGRPMVDAAVTVFAPGDDPELFQEGFTDRNGGFAFVPDTPGVWTVHMDDGMGHRLETRITVAADGRPSAPAPPWRPGRLAGAWLGIGTILGLFGVYSMLTARRAPKQAARV